MRTGVQFRILLYRKLSLKQITSNLVLGTLQRTISLGTHRQEFACRLQQFSEELEERIEEFPADSLSVPWEGGSVDDVPGRLECTEYSECKS